MITIVQRAKFALMYQVKPAVVEEYDRQAVGKEKQECGPVQPAIVDVNGLQLHSETPKDAAQAARINEALDRLHQSLPPIPA